MGSRLVAACSRRSRCCARLCSLTDTVGCDCADERRVALLRLECALHLCIVGLSTISLLGLFGSTLDHFPWANYHAWLHNAVTNTTELCDIHINLWGACLYQSHGLRRCAPWHKLTGVDMYADDCGAAAAGVRVQVILAVLTNLMRAINVRQRCVRANDRHLKCLQVVTCVVPLCLMGAGAFQFNQQCYRLIEDPSGAAIQAARSVGFNCFAIGVFLNLPCFFIQLVIPVRPRSEGSSGLDDQLVAADGAAEPRIRAPFAGWFKRRAPPAAVVVAEQPAPPALDPLPAQSGGAASREGARTPLNYVVFNTT